MKESFFPRPKLIHVVKNRTEVDQIRKNIEGVGVGSEPIAIG